MPRSVKENLKNANGLGSIRKKQYQKSQESYMNTGKPESLQDTTQVLASNFSVQSREKRKKKLP